MLVISISLFIEIVIWFNFLIVWYFQFFFNKVKQISTFHCENFNNLIHRQLFMCVFC